MIILRKTKSFAKISHKILEHGNRIIRETRKNTGKQAKEILEDVNKKTHEKFEALRKEMGL